MSQKVGKKSGGGSALLNRYKARIHIHAPVLQGKFSYANQQNDREKLVLDAVISS